MSAGTSICVGVSGFGLHSILEVINLLKEFITWNQRLCVRISAYSCIRSRNSFWCLVLKSIELWSAV